MKQYKNEFEKDYIIRLTILTVFDIFLSLLMAFLIISYVFAFQGGAFIVNLKVHGGLCIAILIARVAVSLKKVKLQKTKIDHEESMEDTQ